MTKLITADDLEWKPSRLDNCDRARIGKYLITRLSNGNYIVYQKFTHPTIFDNLDDVLLVLNHDLKGEV